MATINLNYNKLAAGYLFPEIRRRTEAFLEENSGVEVMMLGVGDTTEPLTPAIIKGMHDAVDALGNADTYTGYGKERGMPELREALSERYDERGVLVKPSEIFISDGAKPDSANIQTIFGPADIVAVQDPAYPVYVDSNVIAGRTGGFNEKTGKYEGIVYMPCTEENGFFPEVPDQKVDLIYICSPNNPTGAVATVDQLSMLVDYARRNKAVIIFDAAYAAYVSDPNLPRSIYEIDGSKECAIEISSFSKDTGFTGVRLGWTVVPYDVIVKDTSPGEIRSAWNRRMDTFFNEAPNVSQAGGLAALSGQGREECQGLVDYYMRNAKVIKGGLDDMGMVTFGGVNAPYIWLRTPDGMGSWDFFNKMLSEAHVVGTPGVGFGPSGEGYFRLSAFGHTENIEKAVDSIRKNLRL